MLPTDSEPGSGSAAIGATQDHRRRRDRGLISNALSGVGTGVVVVVLAAFAVSLTVRALGDVQFGVVATLGTLTGMLTFADLGVGMGLVSRLSIAFGEDAADDMRELVSTAVVTLAGIGLLVTAVGLASIPLVPWPSLLGAPQLPPAEVDAAVAAFFVCLGLGIPAGIGQRVLMGLQRGLQANVWTAAAAAVTVTAVALAAIMDAPLWAFLAATVGAPVLVGIVESGWVLWRQHRHLSPAVRLATRESARSLAHIGVLFLVLTIAVAIAYQTDTLIVSGVLGAGSAAVFAVSLRMFSWISGAVSVSSRQLWPAMAEALTRQDLHWVRSRFLGVLRWSLLVSAAASLGLVILGRPLVRVWVGPSLVPPVSLLVAFAVWTVYGAAMTQCSALLNAAEVVRAQVWMASSMAVANIALSLWLTTKVGLVGPLWGSLAAHVVFAGVPTVILVRRVLRSGRTPHPPVEVTT